MKRARITTLRRQLLGLAAIACSCLAQDANRGFHISGTVTNSQTGQPVKQALVIALAAQPGERSSQLPALTDGMGNFVLTGLGPGQYQLTVQKNGYTHDPDMAAEPVEIGPSRDAVTLRIQPLGKITGKVTDSDGDPVPGVAIPALHAVIQEGRRSFKEDRSVSTDDRGQYRLWNLPAGEYYIAAAGRYGGTLTYVGPISSGGVHEGFSPVYYPAARDRASATPIAMAPGQEFTADMKIAMQPAFRVRGTLRNVSVREAVKVELLRDAGEIGVNRVLVNSATGRFEANDVVPGTYLLRASQGRGETEVRGEQQVQVRHADVEGLVVELLPGVKVTGVVRGRQEVNAGRRAIRPRCDVSLLSSETGLVSPLQTVVDDDGNFTFNAVHPGRYRVRVLAFGGYVASLVSGTADLTKGAELTITPGASPRPLEIVLRYDGGSIAGTIDESAKVADSSWVLVAPVVGGEAQRAVVYQRNFEFHGVAPGDYQAYLFKTLENIEYNNPDVVRALKGGETVHVTAGSEASVTLRAVSR